MIHFKFSNKSSKANYAQWRRVGDYLRAQRHRLDYNDKRIINPVISRLFGPCVWDQFAHRGVAMEIPEWAVVSKCLRLDGNGRAWKIMSEARYRGDPLHVLNTTEQQQRQSRLKKVRRDRLKACQPQWYAEIRGKALSRAERRAAGGS